MTYIQLNIIMLVYRNQDMKKKLTLDYLEKIKELKNWSHMHAPSFIEPALSYALGWLSPELLGTGFHLNTLNDESVSATVPYKNSNCDFQGQIHLGLVVNAGQEIVNSIIARHWPKQAWLISEVQIDLIKKLHWRSDLQLFVHITSQQMDKFIVDLQQNKSAEIIVDVSIHPKKQNKKDFLKFKFLITKTNILS
jgi:hypothetical protein